MSNNRQSVSIMRFRRDLRFCDNTALYYHALKNGLPVFIFDSNILNSLTNKSDARIAFIHRELTELKNLLVDWRWGECYFAEKLLDYDLSANNGNWQWVAGCGCDAAPHLRIFNPSTQQKKLAPELKYIKKWVPESGTADYPPPIIKHKYARQRCLATYKIALFS